MTTTTTDQSREATFYVARCDELVRLLLRLLEGATRPQTLRFADRQRLKRLLRRLQEGIQQLTITL
ncbi:hypothetical protein [Armatimonas rosea]|uniref:Uncharacterized protein n=1 Tax=Armatimonas rosea TaxID=685828 RepID=A0A7W9SVZ2_ARMRO|nr:hypothetical protein [Armatimonas rosea]MBB6053855.1 hypothetical protein [Armatimonas rosea]